VLNPPQKRILQWKIPEDGIAIPSNIRRTDANSRLQRKFLGNGIETRRAVRPLDLQYQMLHSSFLATGLKQEDLKWSFESVAGCNENFSTTRLKHLGWHERFDLEQGATGISWRRD
jgi:hypothetical protein